MKSYSPLRYPGGKGQMYKYVENLLNSNNLIGCTYIEPFCGGAGLAMRLLFEGKVSKVVLNDLDKSIYAFWVCVTKYNDEFITLIENCSIDIDEWHRQKKVQNQKNEYNLKNKQEILQLGFSTFFLNRTNRSGIIKAGVIGGKQQSGNYKMDCRFNKKNLTKLIRKIGTYSDKILVENLEAVEFIKKVERYTRKSFYFIDPPYYNKGKDLYTNFLLYEDHVAIEKCIRKYLKNKYWVVTYDFCSEIREIYGNYNYLEIDLRYSLAQKTYKKEYFFYNKISIN